jgi:hypothetical protein
MRIELEEGGWSITFQWPTVSLSQSLLSQPPLQRRQKVDKQSSSE